MTGTHRNQRSASHATSAVGAEVHQYTEIAEKPQGFPHSDSPVNGYCKICGDNLFFSSSNSWHKITGSYYVPVGSYRSRLKKTTGKPKAASKGTVVENCSIQPLSCPTPGCGDNSPIGFTVVEAPPGKELYHGRDFFKLRNIELRCEEDIVVKPQYTTTALLVDDSESTSPAVGRVPSAELMEFSSRRPSLRAPPSPSVQHSSNGQPYPRPPKDVSLDALERIQTQVTQNTGALAAQSRDIRAGEDTWKQLEATIRREVADQMQRQKADMQRVGDDIGRLHMDLRGLQQAIEGLGREIAVIKAQQRAGVQPGRGAAAQDSAIELMAQQVEIVSQKVNEFDALKLRVEILKGKVHRLEDGDAAAPAPHTMQVSKVHGFQSPQQQMVHVHHSTPTYQQQPQPAFHTLRSSVVASSAPPGPELVANQGVGWETINGGTKRSLPSPDGIDSSHHDNAYVAGSPKRQKIAVFDPHASYTPSQPASSQQTSEQTTLGSSNPRSHAPPPSLPVLPSQHSISESTPAQSPRDDSPFPADFGTQDGPSDDSWRPASQRFAGPRPRGRPRGSGVGSRGGRGRKSIPPQARQLGTPEWEKDDWQGVPDSQAGPNGYYNHLAHAGRGVARRGSGGGGRGSYTQSDRAMSMGSQGVSPGADFRSPSDHYHFNKKTRSKPTRNADGILIRKDGRPDMRSQSSAANLRKVHARKEGDASNGSLSAGFQHTSALFDTPSTPSPSSYEDPNQPAPTSAQRKHNTILAKIFPKGIDKSRKEHDYAHQLFEQDRAHPSSQTLAHTQPSKAVSQMKKEALERSRLSVSESPNNDEDVEMGEQGNTPGGQSDIFHDAQTQDQAMEPIVPETQDSSMTVAPETQASITVTPNTQVS